MRIMLLTDMLAELRYEARLSSNIAHGGHLAERHISLLRRVQEELYDEFDWPMLDGHETVRLDPGQRYVAYPTMTEFEGIKMAHARADGDDRWRPLVYGIGTEQLDYKDSDAGEREDHLERWHHHVPGDAPQVTTTMFEVWPLPEKATDVRFDRKRKLARLEDPEEDHSTLDGMSVVLHAAAEILSGQQAADAQLKLQKAQQRVNLSRMRQSAPNNRPTVMGFGQNHSQHRGPRWPTN